MLRPSIVLRSLHRSCPMVAMADSERLRLRRLGISNNQFHGVQYLTKKTLTQLISTLDSVQHINTYKYIA